VLTQPALYSRRRSWKNAKEYFIVAIVGAFLALAAVIFLGTVFGSF